MSRRILIVLMGVLFFGSGYSQDNREGTNFPPLPQEQTEQLSKLKNLPLRADNSLQPYFPPIIQQLGWSCNQASSIGYLLTYELNRKREADGDLPENQMSPAFPYNVLTSESETTGVSYFDTWEIIKAHGCANIVDFSYTIDHKTWMNGYEKYLRAMKNRAVNNYSLDVSNSTQLRILKSYLFNHNDNYRFGGVANLQIASTGMRLQKLPDDSYLITSFGSNVGHALTVVGFNDEIQYDFNHDGLYTNNLDLNNDGQVTMADWEVGALVVVNSWGKGWGNRGKAYLPYRLLTKYGYEGGIWNRSVHLVDVVHDYEPQLVARVEMQHSHRSLIKISVGCANDTDADYPEFIKEFPIFNYHGGEGTLGSVGDGNHMDIALDISSLLEHVDSGKEVKFFLLISEKDPVGTGQGVFYRFEVNHYSPEGISSTVNDASQNLLDNQTTILPVSLELDFEKLAVAEYSTLFTNANKWLSIPLQSLGSTGGTDWEVVPDYKEDSITREFPESYGEYFPFRTSQDGYLTIDLPFEFPFYGENHDQLFADEDGNLYLETQYLDYPYSIDQNLVFKQRKNMLPFGTSLIFSASGGGVYYYSTDSVAQLVFHCQAALDGHFREYKYAVNLYPDGLIEFHYSDFNLDNPVRVNYQSALSRGNGNETFVTTPSRMSYIVPNQVVQLIPYRIPPKTKIESNNYLLTRPEEENENFEIRVKVTDSQAKKAYGLIPISTVDLSSDDLEATAYPNPFTDQVRIDFYQRTEGHVQVKIFNLKGQLMATLLNDTKEKGQHTLVWNGRTGAGGQALNGMYLVKVISEEDEQHVKIAKFAW